MKHYEAVEINLNKIRIKYQYQEIVRVTYIEIGNTYWVHPDNPLKLKHRGKQCVVTNFYRNDLGQAIDASVRFLTDNRKGRVDLNDLVDDESEHAVKPLCEKYNDTKQYSPDKVPDYLFTKNELKRMGRVPIKEHATASVYYSDQNRSFPLFDLQVTRETRQQKGLSLVNKEMTPEDIISRRKRISGGYTGGSL